MKIQECSSTEQNKDTNRVTVKAGNGGEESREWCGSTASAVQS